MTVRNTLIATALLFAAGNALADTLPLMFEVEAEIRNDTFMILPQGGWNTTETKLEWRPDLGKLLPVTRSIHVKSSLGAVSAHLDVAPVLRFGVTSVPMKISLGGDELKVGAADKITIVSAINAAVGVNLPLLIEVPTPGAGFQPGFYRGAVNMTFESVVP